MWQCQKIEALSSLELYKILKLRVDTFVVAQARIYPEVDPIDTTAFHLYYEEPVTKEITAYARLFKEAGHVTFGRVVIAENKRGTGFGNDLIDHVLSQCQLHWPDEAIIIEAQEQVTGYYEKHGFTITSKPFLFNHTPHIQMTYRPITKK